MDVISYDDTSAVAYDPAEPHYWEPASLAKELDRTFEICHGCRMCFKYCPSFPSLFAAIDGHANGDVRLLTEADKSKVVGECYQCKLCYVQCPYTDVEKHAYNLNFPALMQRVVHVDARRDGVGLRDRVLQDADLAGRMNSGLLSGLVNRVMKSGLHRRLMELILGVHRDKLMPEFHRTTFMRWFRKTRGPLAEGPPPGEKQADDRERVVLFATCFVNYNNPAVGRDCVEVLEKNGVEIACPNQNCCGMPGINSGDLDFAQEKMKRNVESLLPYAKAGYKILAINPTCSLTLKKEYALFLPPGEWREKASIVSAAVRDVHEYLFELKQRDRLNRDFQSTPGKVAYHVPCHLRAQNIGFRSRDILRLIPDASIGIASECCGHDGTWAMKTENFALSLDAGRRAFEALKEEGAERTVTDCPLAALQLEQGMGLAERPMHPVQILARAYRAPDQGGFPTPVSPAPAEES